MRKLVACISFLVYLTVTCGVVINHHYCMDKLASVHLYQTSVDVCGRCGMDMHDSFGCCHDEVKVVKLDQDQQKMPVTLFALASLEPVEMMPSSYLVAGVEPFSTQRHFRNHSPPLLSGQYTYLQISVFRI